MVLVLWGVAAGLAGGITWLLATGWLNARIKNPERKKSRAYLYYVGASWLMLGTLVGVVATVTEQVAFDWFLTAIVAVYLVIALATLTVVYRARRQRPTRA